MCSIKRGVINAYGEQAETFVRQQAGAAIQNFLLRLTEEGLATCWTGHFVDNMIKRILEIPEDIDIEALFTIGYASKAIGQQKDRKDVDIDTILYFNKYKNKKMIPVKKLEV